MRMREGDFAVGDAGGEIYRDNVCSERNSVTEAGLATSNLVGAVVIGRNEGQRLRRCIESLRGLENRVVYVDSGSSDDSVSIARALGCAVVVLDMSKPFTAARARNAGFERLLAVVPTLSYVFFVDGDCEVEAGWAEKARHFLDSNSGVAVVWGRRRERYPQHSVYNMLCDIEWGGVAIGETRACGGDAVMRVSVFNQIGGYRPDL